MIILSTYLLLPRARHEPEESRLSVDAQSILSLPLNWVSTVDDLSVICIQSMYSMCPSPLGRCILRENAKLSFDDRSFIQLQMYCNKPSSTGFLAFILS
jgi:hypothetical protein